MMGFASETVNRKPQGSRQRCRREWGADERPSGISNLRLSANHSLKWPRRKAKRLNYMAPHSYPPPIPFCKQGRPSAFGIGNQRSLS